MKDFLGQELQSGDFIVYFVRGSTLVHPRTGIVDRVKDDGAFVYSGSVTNGSVEITKRLKLTNPSCVKVPDQWLDPRLVDGLLSALLKAKCSVVTTVS